MNCDPLLFYFSVHVFKRSGDQFVFSDLTAYDGFLHYFTITVGRVGIAVGLLIQTFHMVDLTVDLYRHSAAFI